MIYDIERARAMYARHMSHSCVARAFGISYERARWFARKHGLKSLRRKGECVIYHDNLGIAGRLKGAAKGFANNGDHRDAKGRWLPL